MGNIVWPPSLPNAFEIGVRDQSQMGFLRTPMEAGPTKQRRRFSSTTRRLIGKIHLDEMERETFDLFYRNTIAEGSLCFNFPDPSTNQVILCRFIEPPTFVGLRGGASGGELWEMQFALEGLVSA